MDKAIRLTTGAVISKTPQISVTYGWKTEIEWLTDSKYDVSKK